MLLVYTHKITPRFTYIFKHIFTRILGITTEFTTKVEDFVAHGGPKLTYTKTPLGKEFFIRNHGLLFEQGIDNQSIKISHWDKIPCFFATSEQSRLPFDIFAASFYLITRYEEYQPYVSDTHERYSAMESIAFKNDFLKKPLVDIWALKLLEALKEKFPEYDFPSSVYQKISTINVAEAYSYKNKGAIRNIVGFVNDLVKLRFRSITRRFAVLLRIKEDPYDTFDRIIALGKEHNVKTLFFFLFSEYTTFDNNVSYSNRNYRLLIKSIIDYAPFGQLYSYYTMKKNAKINKEKNNLENVVNRPLLKSKQHYNRMKIPKTYQNLIDMGIEEDYSMGYHTHCGFRASTCTPFYFYDLDYEIQTPLRIFPFAVRDSILLENQKLTTKEALMKIKELQYEVQQVGGTFISVFHNSTLSDMQQDKGWSTLYEKVIGRANE